jgi:hypothetical protein
MSTATKLVLMLALIVLLVVFGPFATIWSLNTLFPALAIGYTFETWLAIILLSAAIRSNITMKK